MRPTRATGGHAKPSSHERYGIGWVRRKLGAALGEPGRIKTLKGIGYLLDVEQRSSADPRDAAEDESERPPKLVGYASDWCGGCQGR
jgi:hypothetical protein